MNYIEQNVKSLTDWINSHNAWAGGLSNRVANLEKWQKGNDSSFEGVWARLRNIENWQPVVDNRFNTHLGYIANLERWQQGNDSSFEGVWARLRNLEGWQKAVDDKFNTHLGYIANLEKWQKGNDAAFDSIRLWQGDVDKKFATHLGYISNLEKWQKGNDTAFDSLRKRATKLENWQGDVDKKFESHLSYIANLEKWQKAGDQKFENILSYIATLEKWQKGNDLAFDEIRAVNKEQSSDLTKLKAFELAQAVWNSNQSNRISELEATDTAILNALTTEHNERVEGDKELANALQKESENRKATDNVTALKLISIDEAIAKVNKRIDNLSFDFSDVGIIASIVSLKQSNENLWNADNYDGGSVSENDGKAVRLFKNQFQGLKTHYAAIMRTYFDMDDKDSAIYRLRYSIVAGFEETKNLLVEWFTLISDSLNTTNTHLNSVNTWLELQNKQFEKFYEVYIIITKWLEQIYKKPPPVVNVTVPPIELDENGNGWLKTLIKTVGDVMKTAIETLGSLLETAIGEVGQLLRDLLAFLDGLIDDLLHLVVPENLDFMDHKFDSTSKTIKLKFSSIFDGIDAFKGMFGSKAVFKDIEMNLGSFGKGSFKLPVSMLNEMAPYVKALITGAVALEFLIDMYKWFHTRGEVIE